MKKVVLVLVLACCGVSHAAPVIYAESSDIKAASKFEKSKENIQAPQAIQLAREGCWTRDQGDQVCECFQARNQVDDLIEQALGGAEPGGNEGCGATGTSDCIASQALVQKAHMPGDFRSGSITSMHYDIKTKCCIERARKIIKAQYCQNKSCDRLIDHTEISLKEIERCQDATFQKAMFPYDHECLRSNECCDTY